MTERVGTVGEVAEESEAKEKTSGRQVFDIAAYGKEVADTVDVDGLLLSVPKTYKERKNKPLKKDDFASEATYIHYQSLVFGQKAEYYATKSAEFENKAIRIEKFGSESARKTANKLAKAKAQMVKLTQTLLDTGMDQKELDDILAGM